MPGPHFRARLRLSTTDEGGRRGPIFADYRPDWDLGNTWLGKPTLNGGPIVLEDRDELALGAQGFIRVHPLVPELWGRVRPGSVIAMHEGSRVVGHATILEILSRPASWSPETCVFVDQARQYCAFIEKAHECSLDERLATARQRLLELYDAGSRLPDLEPPEWTDPLANRERPDEWPGFDRFDGYWEVFDPYDESQPVAGSLTDDLLDVFADLQRGLVLWDKAGATDNDTLRIAAIWTWRFHFGIHWGDHAIDALRALHRANKPH